MRAELCIPRDPAFVGLARLVVAHAARLAGVPQDRVEDVKIAVAEALAAAGVDADADRSQDPLVVRFGATIAGFEVVVVGVDKPALRIGRGDPEAHDVLDPKLSLTLIDGLTDEFALEVDDGHVRLRFVVGAE